MLPHSEACERNKDPILDVLSRRLDQPARVLEIGAGTGQHAVHFARHLPHLTWQPSEHPGGLATLRARVAAEGPANLAAPIALDMDRPADWPTAGRFDALFTANTLHIVGRPSVEAFFAGVANLFGGTSGSQLIVYGPFKYGGRFTTASNEAFDRMLRERDPRSGLRDFEWIDGLARQAGLQLVEDCPMPANNQTITWRRGDRTALGFD